MGEQEGARDGVAHHQADDADVAEEEGHQRPGPVDDPLAPRLPPALPASAAPSAITSALAAAIAARRAGRLFVRLHPDDDDDEHVTFTGSPIRGHRASGSPSTLARPIASRLRDYTFRRGKLRALDPCLLTIYQRSRNLPARIRIVQLGDNKKRSTGGFVLQDSLSLNKSRVDRPLYLLRDIRSA